MNVDSYYVSYTICDGNGRGAVGSGSIVVPLDEPPGDYAEVQELGREITRFNHDDGKLHGQYVTVNSWSKMGS